MVNAHKTIVLLKGLEPISDRHFSLFKSLLASDLRLERNKQEQYSRIQIADMMEDAFPDDVGLGELIKFCEGLPALRKRAKILKKERAKVIRGTSLEMNRQEGGPATPTSTASHMLASERGETSTAQEGTTIAQAETSTAQKRKSRSNEKTGVKKTKTSKEPDKPLCPEESTVKCQPPVPQISSSASSNTLLAKKKRKGATKTEGGKRKRITQEQAQLPEPLGTDLKKDEDCVQTSHKPPSTPPSSSSNKKQKITTIQKHSIIKTEGPQKKQQLVESSSTSSFPAVSELLIFEELSATASSSPQSSQKPREAHMDLKMSPGSSNITLQEFSST
ncbi:interferon-activable protein 205-B-like [Mastomys coucha]|uniref:interferon-activable protein 205-B-like n=1 Tax=Mastomys coucha TaxID=35658 RepID=UPI001261A097|nr:interferon-activable protein 205-B-like [Mastomys coucha]